MLINLSNGVAGSRCLGFLIKVARYNPLTAMQGSVFGPRCSAILKKPGNPISREGRKQVRGVSQPPSAGLRRRGAFTVAVISPGSRSHRPDPVITLRATSAAPRRSNRVQDFNAITAAFARPETATAQDLMRNRRRRMVTSVCP